MGYKLKRATIRPNGTEKQVRPEIPPYLCFTAEEAGSTIKLSKSGSPTSVSIETSTDGNTWTDYSRQLYGDGTLITLSNVGDKVYRRNKSSTPTRFSVGFTNYYIFYMTGSIAANGDINYLLCKDGCDTITGSHTFANLFYDCDSLTVAPSLPATTLDTYCYSQMFALCNNLATLPILPAVTLKEQCYSWMFAYCTKIKLSETQTGEYQTAYRIPSEGTGTDATNSMSSMFANTGGSFTSDPSINTTYYTSNTVV